MTQQAREHVNTPALELTSHWDLLFPVLLTHAGWMKRPLSTKVGMEKREMFSGSGFVMWGKLGQA